MRIVKKFELYLGRSKPDGFLISPGAFRQFLVDYVDRRLNGYTVVAGRGYWKGEPEESFILSVIGPAGLGEELREIARAYNRRFHQEAVYLTAYPLEIAELVTEINSVSIAAPLMDGPRLVQ